MTFALTKYIFPLKESILLSKHLNYKIDNPRTIEEIELIEKFITPTLEDFKPSDKGGMLPLHTRTAFSIIKFKEMLKINGETDYAFTYYNTIVKKV